MKHVTGVDEASDNHVARTRNFIREDDPGQPGLYELPAPKGSSSSGVLARPLPLGERIEIARVAVENLSPNEPVQRIGNHRLGLRSEPLNPVADIVLFRFGRDFPQDRVEHRTTGLGRIDQTSATSDRSRCDR